MAMVASIARSNVATGITTCSSLRQEERNWGRVSRAFSRSPQPATKQTVLPHKVSLCSSFDGVDVRTPSRPLSRKAKAVNRVQCQAAAGGEEAAPIEVPKIETPKESELTKTLQLGALFGGWYLFNIYFNIYNKQVTQSQHCHDRSLHCLENLSELSCDIGKR